MGYRSKVIIGVKSGKLSDEFDDILRKHDFPVDKPNGDYLKTIDDPNEMKRYQFEQIKWYESDDGIKEIVDWLEKVENCQMNLNGLQDVFCVGMGYDDGALHNEVGDYWDYVDVISDINLID